MAGGGTRNQVMMAVAIAVSGLTFPAPIAGVTTWNSPPLVNGKIVPLKLWKDVDVSAQPACFLVTHREVDEYRGLGLYRRRLNLELWCYSPGGVNYSGSAQDDLDNMMQAFESVINVVDNPSEGTNTLDGLVYWCRIEGRVLKVPGDIDGQSLLICPLIVEMP